jgi:hypothetical protein
MTAKQEAETRGANHARHAIQAALDELAPILHRMPEGGIIGQGVAILQNCQRQLNAALREMGSEDGDRTPLPTSQSQTGFRAIVVKEIFDEVNKKK